MAFKVFVVIATLVVVAHGSVVPDVKANDDSSFAYGVADSFTGDYKSHVESRVDGVVRGQYSLVDPDGTQRVVVYSADDVNGFNAVVRKEPVIAAPVVASSPSVIATASSVVVPSLVRPPLVAVRNVITPTVSSSTEETGPRPEPNVVRVPAAYSNVPSVYTSRVLPSYQSSIFSPYVYPAVS